MTTGIIFKIICRNRRTAKYMSCLVWIVCMVVTYNIASQYRIVGSKCHIDFGNEEERNSTLILQEILKSPENQTPMCLGDEMHPKFKKWFWIGWPTFNNFPLFQKYVKFSFYSHTRKSYRENYKLIFTFRHSNKNGTKWFQFWKIHHTIQCWLSTAEPIL